MKNAVTTLALTLALVACVSVPSPVTPGVEDAEPTGEAAGEPVAEPRNLGKRLLCTILSREQC